MAGPEFDDEFDRELAIGGCGIKVVLTYEALATRATMEDDTKQSAEPSHRQSLRPGRGADRAAVVGVRACSLAEPSVHSLPAAQRMTYRWRNRARTAEHMAGFGGVQSAANGREKIGGGGIATQSVIVDRSTATPSRTVNRDWIPAKKGSSGVSGQSCRPENRLRTGSGSRFRMLDEDDGIAESLQSANEITTCVDKQLDDILFPFTPPIT
ncbi:hypothetical protein Dimus_025338 [Dionaea muscipula]